MCGGETYAKNRIYVHPTYVELLERVFKWIEGKFGKPDLAVKDDEEMAGYNESWGKE